MTTNLYDRVRRKLFHGHPRDAFGFLLHDRTCVTGPVQGTAEEFSLVLCELTNGDLDKRNETVAYTSAGQGKNDLLKFRDGTLFRVVRTKSGVGGPLIVVTPHEPTLDDLMQPRELPLSALVRDRLRIRDIFANVAIDYRTEERKIRAEQEARERRIASESSIESALATIEKAKSGSTIMIRGMQNIVDLVKLGFQPGLVENPDNWIDADDYPGLRYRHERTGIDVLLTGRERFRPIEELNRLEFHFLALRSDIDPAAYSRMAGKFRERKRDGSPYETKEFHDNLIALVKYPEELKGRSEADLGLMADEVGIVIERRQELDKGILPYEAVFRKDTLTIVEFIRANRTPAAEIRKALDYFEYTGMIDQQYKAALLRQIESALAAPLGDAAGNMQHEKRIKEIVAEVLRKIPKERLTSTAITIAMTPYVGELGFGRLVKIRERILQLKQLVHDQ